MRTILTTVGTSLLSNLKRAQENQIPTDQEFANFLRHTDPVKSSAETNSLSRLLQPEDRIILIHSHTPEGKQCAQALERFYDGQNYFVDLQEIADLTYKESRFKMRGLRSLVAKLCDLIRREQRQGHQVLINATGGFKAEIAYATLVGLLFDTPVYYIHELFQEIIEMPASPVSWDYSLLAIYDEFFEWIHSDYRVTTEVDQRLRGLPNDIKLLLSEEEEFTLLSPAGEAFYEAYQQEIEQAERVALFLSANAKATLTENLVDSEIQSLFKRTFAKLRRRNLWLSGADRVGNCDCLVFPKGHRDERVFFFEDTDGAIRICEIARHSDKSYERLIQKGVKRDNYKDFEEWIS